MSAERVIPAQRVDHGQVEAFPYFTAQFCIPLEEGEEGDDASLGSTLSTPEEDARRLASVDQVIFQKLEAAEREAQDMARRGYETGFRSGEQEGRQSGESEYKTHLQRLEGHLQELSLAMALGERAAKDEILALALALGEYLAGREIHEGALTLRPLLDTILEARPFPAGPGDGPELTAITVHLNLQDLEELGAGAQLQPGVTLKVDPELSRGGLRLESAIGVLDATLEHRKLRALEFLNLAREKDTP